ncbi:MAG: tRNA (adenosine(37)-N6)-threonylcarbamoyltransferase complex ATPase subunit type 1 TsaE [Kiloniellaceae bacterium]
MAAPLPRPATLSVELPDEAATAALARSLAARAALGDVIALFGDLGSGKTAFARAFINALPRPARETGAPAAAEEEVPSPTFTLLQTYEREPAPVWHFDLYRVERPEEVYELGFEEASGHAIVLIEWAERLGPLLPADRIEVRLDFADDPGARRASLVATRSWRGRLEGLARHG